MTALGLTPLAHLTEVGAGFLYGCGGLTAMDLCVLEGRDNEHDEGGLDGLDWTVDGPNDNDSDEQRGVVALKAKKIAGCPPFRP